MAVASDLRFEVAAIRVTKVSRYSSKSSGSGVVLILLQQGVGMSYLCDSMVAGPAVRRDNALATRPRLNSRAYHGHRNYSKINSPNNFIV